MRAVGAVVSVMFDEFGQGANVRLGHLERFELTQFAIAAQLRDDFSETLECVVEAVHSTSFAGVGG